MRGDNAVARNLALRHLLHAEHAAAVILIDVDKLREARHFRVDEIVTEEHSERLVSDELACAEHGMAESARLLLANEVNLDVRDLLDHLEHVILAVLLELHLKLQ